MLAFGTTNRSAIDANGIVGHDIAGIAGRTGNNHRGKKLYRDARITTSCGTVRESP